MDCVPCSLLPRPPTARHRSARRLRRLQEPIEATIQRGERIARSHFAWPLHHNRPQAETAAAYAGTACCDDKTCPGYSSLSGRVGLGGRGRGRRSFDNARARALQQQADASRAWQECQGESCMPMSTRGLRVSLVPKAAADQRGTGYGGCKPGVYRWCARARLPIRRERVARDLGTCR